jgi:hypothetical protein
MKTSKQLFHRGDRVRIADKLPRYMSHFTSGKNATVIGSYEDQYSAMGWDKSREPQYSLNIDGQGHCSWYEQNQLTFLPEEQKKVLRKRKRQIECQLRKLGDSV